MLARFLIRVNQSKGVQIWVVGVLFVLVYAVCVWVVYLVVGKGNGGRGCVKEVREWKEVFFKFIDWMVFTGEKEERLVCLGKLPGVVGEVVGYLAYDANIQLFYGSVLLSLITFVLVCPSLHMVFNLVFTAWRVVHFGYGVDVLVLGLFLALGEVQLWWEMMKWLKLKSDKKVREMAGQVMDLD